MPTLTVDAHREQMMQALQAADRYRFLNMAAPYLRVCPEDHYVRLMAVRSYLEFGLIAPARDLLDSLEATAGTPAELMSVRQSLASVSGGQIPWSQHAGRYGENLAALRERGVDIAPIREAWNRQQDLYQLFSDRNGASQVRVRDEQGVWTWVTPLENHGAVDDSQPLPLDIQTNMPGPYLFEGLALGGYFERVYKASRDTFLGFSCALFVVESNPAAIAVPLHLCDWGEILADRRVFIFVGDSWADQLRRAWDEDVDLPLPRQLYRLGATASDDATPVVDVVHDVQRAREEAVARSLDDLEARYAPRDVAYWARRIAEALSGQGPPLRILAAVSTHTTFLQYSIRDAQRAFESLGHRCIVLSEKTPYDTVGHLTYHNAMRELDPDIFFALDHLRPEFSTVIPRNLPILTWDQDQLPHVITRANIAGLAGHDFVVGCSKSQSVALGANPKQFLSTCMPTCPEQFGGQPLSEEESDRYACDVSYVSHASQTAQSFHEEERAGQSDPRLAQLLDVMYELMQKMLQEHDAATGAVMSVVLEEGKRRCGIETLDKDLTNRLMNWYLWRLGDRLFRHQALEWVAQWTRRSGRSFRIYGNGWDKHPTLAEFAAGPAANGRELLCVYRASRINLQLMPAGFIHQRALDGLAAGGFFLTRSTPNDLKERVLRRLNACIQEMNIASTRQLMESDDDTLRSLCREYFGDGLLSVDPDKDDVLGGLETATELPTPDEVFPHFREIVFDSASTFAAAADRFLEDESRRRFLTAEMRDVVIKRFSYQAAMDQFLRAMADYLLEASS